MITDGELRIAKQGAMSAARSGRGIVDPGDLVSEAHLWIVEHMDKVIAEATATIRTEEDDDATD